MKNRYQKITKLFAAMWLGLHVGVFLTFVYTLVLIINYLAHQ